VTYSSRLEGKNAQKLPILTGENEKKFGKSLTGVVVFKHRLYNKDLSKRKI